MKAKHSPLFAILFVVAALGGCGDSGNKDKTPTDPGSNSENQESEQSPEQPTTYDIALVATDGGSLSLTGTQTVKQGTGFSVTITPDTGYRIASASGCGGILAGNTFSVSAITADCTIDITFSEQITATRKLNDTGITLCGNYDTENEGQWSSTLSCADAGATQTADGIDADGNPVPAGQDPHYGRDALAANSQLSKTGSGDAGFDFTKLDAYGYDLPETATEWSCVRDNVTGLIWEVKELSNGNIGDSLHDGDDRYNWYNTNSSTNGGSDGYADDDGAVCYGYDNADSTAYCNTEAFVNRVNVAGLCGANDWRMPKKEELRSIVHYGRTNPSTDTDYFPNTVSIWHWSGTPYASDSRSAWLVNFYDGYDNAADRSSAAPVLLVRSAP